MELVLVFLSVNLCFLVRVIDISETDSGRETEWHGLFQALGSGFSQFAQPVYQRCISIVQTQQLAKV